MQTGSITGIGNSNGVIIPASLLAEVRLTKGDKVFFTRTKNGIEISAYDPEFAEQIKIGTAVMKKYKDAFRALADK